MNIDRLRQLAGLNEDEKDFEKVAFGDLKGSDEEDTEWEAEVFTALRDFIQIADPTNKVAADAILKDVHALKSKYPDDLVPDSKYAYRGTQLPMDKYKEFLAMYPDDKLDLNDSNLLHVADLMYTPRSPIQSWTTNEYMAPGFATTGDMYTGWPEWNRAFPFPAVLEARVDSTFIMSTELTNRIAKLTNQEPEHEVIRTAGQPISCKVHVMADWLVQARLHLES